MATPEEIMRLIRRAAEDSARAFDGLAEGLRHTWEDVPIERVTVTEIVQHTELDRTQANHLYMLIRRARPAGWRGPEDRRADG